MLEVRGKVATVLTPDGRFLRVRVPAQGWYPGDEVTWGWQWPARLRPVLVLACAVILLFVPGALAYQHYWALGPVVAYVSVDINPSLEFGLDARERVCVARALNPEGEEILAGLRYRRRLLDEVLVDVTVRAVEKGYLGGERAGAILVTVTPAAEHRPARVSPPGRPAGTSATLGPAGPSGAVAGGGEPAAAAPVTAPARGRPGLDPVGVRDEAVRAAERVLRERGVRAAVKGLAAGPEVREEAERLHISPGRLVLYLVARDAGIEVSLEELRRGPVAEIFREARGRQFQKGGPEGQAEERAVEQGREPAGQEQDKVPRQGQGEKPGRAAPGPGQGAGGQPGKGSGRAGQVPAGEKPGVAPRPGEKPGGGPPAGEAAGVAPRGEEPPRDLFEKVWKEAGVEKELPNLMKKFLPPIDGEREKSSGKDKPGGR